MNPASPSAAPRQAQMNADHDDDEQAM